jgi:hypothetical protein
MDDSTISIWGALVLYRMLLDKGRISINGASVKRLRILEERYKNGERQFRGAK